MSIPPPPPPPGQQPAYGQPPQFGAPPQPQGYPPHYGPGPQVPQRTTRASAPIGWAATAAAVLCGVAPVLPWVTGGGESLNGYETILFDDRLAGIAVSFLAGVAAVLLVLGTTIRNRVLFIIGAVFAGLAGLTPLGDLGTISDLNDLGGDISPGVGLIAAIALGLASMTCAIIAAVKSKKVPVSGW